MRRALVAKAAIVLLTLSGSALAATPEQVEADASLMRFLRARLKPTEPAQEQRTGTATQVRVAWIDLNGDGHAEALVYVSGADWCGSGGCSLLVLERNGAGYRVRGDLGVTRLPVAVLSERTSGWRHLSVLVAGGGIIPGRRAVVPFARGQCASNPTVAPARPLKGGAPEQVVIMADLYPFLGQ
jgi:hypothetical protein